MGNAHGHRKHRYPLPQNPGPIYAPPAHPQIPSSAYPSTTQSQSSSKMLSLPYAHVDSSLRALSGQAEGFGRFAIGGLHGPLHKVTTLAGFSDSIVIVSMHLKLPSL
ncbi:hypothetical protein L6164_009864 [Bauhinia variegata]|uniref:Uncharacterized protein n=1 Tax=Bauhinia variegata TaxID=167791 RepID=A0ACB9PL59_BAUVA|nr:hypothetical protein L6164_009864 [Bauhinia variegata]